MDILSGIAYECCVNAHLLTNTPLDLISSHCATTKTRSDKLPGCEDQWIQVGRLLPSTAYECCVNAHILTNTPLDLISSSCVTTKTESLQKQPSDGLVLGLGTALGICSLLLVVGILMVGFIISKVRCSKHDSTTQVITNTKGYAQCHNT